MELKSLFSDLHYSQVEAAAKTGVESYGSISVFSSKFIPIFINCSKHDLSKGFFGCGSRVISRGVNNLRK